MADYCRRYAVVLYAIVLTAVFSYAEEPSNTAGSVKNDIQNQETGEELTTPNGNVCVGMDVSKLYNVFQAKDRILIPETVLKRECHVFKDWTSNDPNDTVTFFVTSGKVTGWHKGYIASCHNKDSAYEYDNNLKIDVWFFPNDLAKWDGEKVNLLDWNQLIQAQKIMFITEYIKQLNLKHNADIKVDMDKYILGMNYYSGNCPEACENIPASGAINNLLISDGKVSEAKK